MLDYSANPGMYIVQGPILGFRAIKKGTVSGVIERGECILVLGQPTVDHINKLWDHASTDSYGFYSFLYDGDVWVGVVDDYARVRLEPMSGKH